MDPNMVTGNIIDAAIKVHSALGPGLLESAYKGCLAHELRKRGMQALTEVELPVHYDGVTIDDTVVLEAVREGLGADDQLSRVTTEGRYSEIHHVELCCFPLWSSGFLCGENKP